MTTTEEKKILDRETGIGGSDAKYLVEGMWGELYDIKKGIKEPDDLSFVLPVQLGIYTEAFNREWFQTQTDHFVNEIPYTMQHKKHKFMLANVDGLVVDDNFKSIGVFEAKHVHAFTKDETILEKYYAQLQHYMIVCALPRAWLSVIFGNHKYKSFVIEKDRVFQDRLITAEKEFWSHVENNDRPNDYVDFNSLEV